MLFTIKKIRKNPIRLSEVFPSNATGMNTGRVDVGIV
jgi:hypothetical protein